MSRALRPGAEVPRSGQYEKITAAGRPTGDEVTATRGKRLPPTPKPGMTYRLVDATRHKRKRSR